MSNKKLPRMWYNARKLRRKATPEERILWQQLRNKELFRVSFRRQYVIGNYITDFYCHKAKIVIELDGSQHAEEENSKKDKKRTKFFEQRGIQVIRFWNDEIHNNLSNIVDYLLETIDQRLIAL